MLLSRFARTSCRFQPFQRWGVRQLSTGDKPKIPLAMVKKLREMTLAPIVDCRNALSEVVPSVEGEKEQLEQAVDWLRKKGVATAAKKSGRAAVQGLVGLRVSADNTAASLIEVNSETDFVAKNEQFQDLVELATSGIYNSDDGSYEGDVLKSISLGDKTVEVATTDLVASIRENLQVRRGAKLSTPDGVIGTYVHSAIGEAKAAGNGQTVQMGKMGALVGFKTNNVKKLADLPTKLAMHIVAAKPKYLSRDCVPAEDIEKEKKVLREQALESGANKPADVIDKMVTGRLNKFFSEKVLLEQEYMLASEGEKNQKVGKILGDGVELTAFYRFNCGEGLEVGEQMTLEEEVAAKLSK